MTAPRPPRPTDAELAILQVLWKHGPCTVRDVHEALCRIRPGGYTTVLKLLQIMTEKGLVVRDESRRTHVYTTTHSREKTQRQLLGDLAQRAFGGSSTRLVVQALSSHKATPEELVQIREILARMEEES